MEQYPTSPVLAAAVIQTAVGYDDLGMGRTCIDLGCGTGVLACACALVETDLVWAIDCDPMALEVAQLNVRKLQQEQQQLELTSPVMFLQAKVMGLPAAQVISDFDGLSSSGRHPRQQQPERISQHHHLQRKGGRHARRKGPEQHKIQTRETPVELAVQSTSTASSSLSLPLGVANPQYDGIPLPTNCVDTVITNPPFGTKHNAGIDMQFLRVATRLARRAVYSFHKTTTREYIQRQVTQWGYQIQVVAEMKFDLPQVYKFHKLRSVDIQVDLIRIILADHDSDEPQG